MYNDLIKKHEEILKNLTEKASEEKDFNERGQFINIQKMIDGEIRFIKDLREIGEDEFNEIDAYKLGVGKILLGQRGSGVTSTLIAECLEYDRPLIFEFKTIAEKFAKRNPELKVGYCHKSVFGGLLHECETNKKGIDWKNEQVNINANTHNVIMHGTKSLKGYLDMIHNQVNQINTVGISYETKFDENQCYWHMASPQTKVEKKEKSNLAKYIYVFSDLTNKDGKFGLIYFNITDGCVLFEKLLRIDNKETLEDRIQLGILSEYKIIIENIGACVDILLNTDKEDMINRFIPNNNMSHDSLIFYMENEGNVMHNTADEETVKALQLFHGKIETKLLRGKLSMDVSTDELSLLREIIYAIYIACHEGVK